MFIYLGQLEIGSFALLPWMGIISCLSVILQSQFWLSEGRGVNLLHLSIPGIHTELGNDSCVIRTVCSMSWYRNCLAMVGLVRASKLYSNGNFSYCFWRGDLNTWKQEPNFFKLPSIVEWPGRCICAWWERTDRGFMELLGQQRSPLWSAIGTKPGIQIHDLSLHKYSVHKLAHGNHFITGFLEINEWMNSSQLCSIFQNEHSDGACLGPGLQAMDATARKRTPYNQQHPPTLGFWKDSCFLIKITLQLRGPKGIKYKLNDVKLSSLDEFHWYKLVSWSLSDQGSRGRKWLFIGGELIATTMTISLTDHSEKVRSHRKVGRVHQPSIWQSSRAVVLNERWFCPPVDIWQHLETFLSQQLGVVECYWHLVGRDRGCC